MLRILRSLNRPQKQAIFLAVDLSLVPVALFLATAIHDNSLSPFHQRPEIWLRLPFLIAMAAVVTVALGLSRIRLNAYQLDAVLRTALLALMLAVVHAGWLRLSAQPVPMGGQVLFATTFFLLSAASRVAMLQLVLWIYRRGGASRPVVIYGAGATGLQLAAALRADKTYDLVAFVDDSPALQGGRVAGVRVHAPQDIPGLVDDKAIRHAILAIPSLTPLKQGQIVKQLEVLGLAVQSLPSFAQLFDQTALIDKLEPVAPQQLLGRDRLDGDIALGGGSYADKTVLISGAGGSIGSELCRQVLSCRPARLILYELNEFALYTIDQELRALCAYVDTEIIPVLGSAADPRQVRQTLHRHRVDVVLHAAAYKHVPLVEQNPAAGATNNVLGTQVLAQAALQAGVGRFILISSDKAVRPANIMGATKRLAEMIVQDLASRSDKTCFTMVRFGNVLGSSGSVIPLFQDQIARGGPVTVTHADVARYFMTVQEAVQLVLLAGSFAKGGEVFALDMGAPVRISDLARQMIIASGLTVRDAANPTGDIEITTIGLRPGEKLREELLIGEDMAATPHPKILCAQEHGLSEIEIAATLKALRRAVDGGDCNAIRAVMWNSVEGAHSPTPSGAASGLAGRKARIAVRR